MKNIITKLFNLEQRKIHDIEIIHVDNEVLAIISLRKSSSKCPVCGTFTDLVHDYRKRTINHAILNNVNTHLIYNRCRYRCPSCGKVFHRVQHERNWTQHSLTIYTKDAGFDVINLYSTDFATSVKKSAIKTLKSKFRNFLTKLGLKRRKNQPPREGYTLIIIFKKNNLSLS